MTYIARVFEYPGSAVMELLCMFGHVSDTGAYGAIRSAQLELYCCRHAQQCVLKVPCCQAESAVLHYVSTPLDPHMARPDTPQDVHLDEDKRTKAVDMLYEAMLFWHDEGQRLIKRLYHKLNMEHEGKEAAAIARLFKDADDRWIDIAAKLAPYQSSKLSSTVVKKIEEKRYVIEVGTRPKDNKEWLEQVEREQAMLPKPNVVQQLFTDQTIDDIEYNDINEQEVH